MIKVSKRRSKLLLKFRGHIIALAIFEGVAYLVWGLMLSLQPPFYPKEAEAKGATPSQVEVTKN